jgi:hypothetical protein
MWSGDLHLQKEHIMAKRIEDEVVYYYDFHPTEKDLEEKPMKYALMGVEEYFAYDPNDPPILGVTAQRLLGWQLDKSRRQMDPLPIEPDGRLWSPHLDSFLIPEGEYLRLYDRHGQLRLTEAEAEARRAEALAAKLRSLGIDPDRI